MKNVSAGSQNGYTLFEVMIVIVFSVSLTALGIVSLNRLQKIFALRSSADEIKSRIQYGRELAIANKKRAVYSISFANSSFVMAADGSEMSRFQLPTGMTMNPAFFNWNFNPVTGTIPSCSPCQLTLTLDSFTEVIDINENGLVN